MRYHWLGRAQRWSKHKGSLFGLQAWCQTMALSWQPRIPNCSLKSNHDFVLLPRRDPPLPYAQFPSQGSPGQPLRMSIYLGSSVPRKPCPMIPLDHLAFMHECSCDSWARIRLPLERVHEVGTRNHTEGILPLYTCHHDRQCENIDRSSRTSTSYGVGDVWRNRHWRWGRTRLASW
ncbi:hypothetical protein FA13DRAFT_339311 [Coprinellus micaceus]|uniref:Uncharacterized protein n=1 Tax=Coprinellus micaceus TaxID=71717 RepID=A0A4Y7TDN8_COPMI|nr:hypothetical protein FA13DRAFT_339311 [Coprinellus micaceus]